MGLQLLAEEVEPVTELADSVYGAGQFRAELVERGHIDRVGPPKVPPDEPDFQRRQEFAAIPSHDENA